MDSASQTSASPPPNDALTLPVEPRESSLVSRPQPSHDLQNTLNRSRPSGVDWLIRLGLFAAALLLTVRQIGVANPNDLVYPLLVCGALAGAYLLASVPAVAAQLRQWASEQPLSAAFLPLLGVLPVIVYARSTPDFDATEVLFVSVLVL